MYVGTYVYINTAYNRKINIHYKTNTPLRKRPYRLLIKTTIKRQKSKNLIKNEVINNVKSF